MLLIDKLGVSSVSGRMDLVLVMILIFDAKKWESRRSQFPQGFAIWCLRAFCQFFVYFSKSGKLFIYSASFLSIVSFFTGMYTAILAFKSIMYYLSV